MPDFHITILIPNPLTNTK